MRLYFLPIIRVPLPSGGEYLAPKYLKSRMTEPYPGLEGVWFSWETYLLEDVGLAACIITPGEHAILSAFTDVISVPEDLEGTLSGAVPTVVDYLEAYNIPASWMNASHTYRQAIRIVLNIWQFHNRYVGIVGERLWVEGGNIDLNTKFNTLPIESQNALKEAASSLGLEWTPKQNDTLRTVLKLVADQLGDVPYKIGDVTI